VLILALDTASPSGSLAVLRDTKIIGVVSTATDETYSSRMFRQLAFLLGELQLSVETFDLFAVNAGPGSFTGLRVGLTATKGWAEIYGKPALGISGLEAVAAQSCSDGLLMPVLDARRGEVYFGLYQREAGELRAPGQNRVASPEEFLAAVDEVSKTTRMVAISPDFTSLGQLAERFRERNIPCESVSPVLAPVIGRLAYQRALRGDTVDALGLDANYVRRSDAELHWKGARRD
jgi:tRNA threonylcarbamoyladenosine biosynthesis protein TsaB